MAVRAAFSGSVLASQRSFVTGCAAPGTQPTDCAHACRPPSASIRSAAATWARLSPPTSAGRTVPPWESSGTTAPACAETPMACTPSRRPPLAASPRESSQACGSTSEGRPPPSRASSGCGAYPCLSTAPVSVSHTTIRVKSGELSNPATIPMAELCRTPTTGRAAPRGGSSGFRGGSSGSRAAAGPVRGRARGVNGRGGPGHPRRPRPGPGTTAAARRGVTSCSCPSRRGRSLAVLRSRSDWTRRLTESGMRSPTLSLTAP